MNKLITSILIILPAALYAQYTSTDKLERTVSFEKESTGNVLYIANFSGDLTVRKGTEIKINATRSIKAKTEGRLLEGKKIQLAVKDLYDTIIVYMEGECGTFTKRKENWNRGFGDWNYDWNACNDRYDYTLDYDIEVPEGTNLMLSTINNGDVNVSDVSGNLKIRNVNGAITVNRASGPLNARTVNGHVDVNFESVPVNTLDLYTLNGDININYSGTLNAEVSFKSFNGDFFTNEEVQQMPVQFVEEISTDKKGVKRKLEARSVLRLGSGDKVISLETFNGDAYLRSSTIKK